MILEKKFIQSLKKQKRKAQSKFYDMCFSPLMSVAIRYNRNQDDAAILVNEAFLKILTKIDTIDHSTSILPWIKRVMVNTSIDHYRKQKKHDHLIHLDKLEYDSELTPQTPENTEFESAEFFESLLDKIPAASRNVFNLYVVDGFSHKEISAMLEISIDTSKWHVKEARKRLRIMYDQTVKKEVG